MICNLNKGYDFNQYHLSTQFTRDLFDWFWKQAQGIGQQEEMDKLQDEALDTFTKYLYVLKTAMSAKDKHVLSDYIFMKMIVVGMIDGKDFAELTPFQRQILALTEMDNFVDKELYNLRMITVNRIRTAKTDLFEYPGSNDDNLVTIAINNAISYICELTNVMDPEISDYSVIIPLLQTLRDLADKKKRQRDNV